MCVFTFFVGDDIWKQWKNKYTFESFSYQAKDNGNHFSINKHYWVRFFPDKWFDIFNYQYSAVLPRHGGTYYPYHPNGSDVIFKDAICLPRKR